MSKINNNNEYNTQHQLSYFCMYHAVCRSIPTPTWNQFANSRFTEFRWEFKNSKKISIYVVAHFFLNSKLNQWKRKPISHIINFNSTFLRCHPNYTYNVYVWRAFKSIWNAANCANCIARVFRIKMCVRYAYVPAISPYNLFVSMYSIGIWYGCKALKAAIKSVDYWHFKFSAIGRLLSNIEE